MSTFVIPGVGALTSSANTDLAIAKVFQNLLLTMLGLTPDDAFAYAQVRVDYQPEGQPAWRRTEDVAFIETLMVTDSYDQIRDQTPVPNDEVSYTLTSTYTRVWEAGFSFWGPNSSQRCRQVKSCMFLDFAHDTLAQSNLWLHTDFDTPHRVPDQFANEWWERWYFKVRMNEFVTETLVQPTMASVELIIVDSTGVVVDTTIQLPGE